MAKKAYNPEKKVSDEAVIGILTGRGIDEQEAQQLLENKKRVRQVSELTAEDVKDLLESNADDFNEDQDLRWTASSGARKFGEKPRRRK